MHELAAEISSAIKNEPSTAVAFHRVVVEATLAALADAKKESAQIHLGMLCAIGLAKDKRLTDEAKRTLNEKVIEAIGEPSTECERDFVRGNGIPA